MQLRRAVRSRQHLRICLCSPSGGGKTFTALRLAHALGGPVGVVDTENGSAELYAGEPNPDGGAFDFSTIDLAQEPGKFSVDNYVKALKLMGSSGIRTVIVDSGSHAWAGPGGVLEFVDEVARRSRGNSKFNAWAEGTPKHHEFLQALLSYPGHLIVTLRTKVEYVQEPGPGGRTTIRKVGLAPIQREGLEYEMTLVGDLEADTHRLVVSKSRCSALADKSFDKPGADMAKVLLQWLEEAPTNPSPSPSTRPTPSSQPPRAPSGAGPTSKGLTSAPAAGASSSPVSSTALPRGDGQPASEAGDPPSQPGPVGPRTKEALHDSAGIRVREHNRDPSVVEGRPAQPRGRAGVDATHAGLGGPGGGEAARRGLPGEDGAGADVPQHPASGRVGAGDSAVSVGSSSPSDSDTAATAPEDETRAPVAAPPPLFADALRKVDALRKEHPQLVADVGRTLGLKSPRSCNVDQLNALISEVEAQLAVKASELPPATNPNPEGVNRG